MSSGGGRAARGSLGQARTTCLTLDWPIAAVIAMIAMPFTYSISNGIALAFISYAAIKIFTGKFGSTNPAIWVIAVLSLVSFAVA